MKTLPLLLAATLALGAGTTARAQESDIIVTATRFDEADPQVAANISVISAQDIRNTPATNVPDLLKAAAGIEVRPLYGAMGIDATIDLRGFGDTAGSNTLVLLNGERLNSIDSSSISWSTIPIDSIERIEIIRGSGAVLYGDQASGGVINIITNRAAPPGASLEATGGSWGYRGADAQAHAGSDGLQVQAYAHVADTDGWRQNTASDQQSLEGRVEQALGDSRVHLDMTGYKDNNGLPGALFPAEFASDPQSTRSPYDHQQRNGVRIRPGVTSTLAPGLQFEAEVGFKEENYLADDVSVASVFERQSNLLSFTPRLRWTREVGALHNETVAGVDYYHGKVDDVFFSPSGDTPEHASQGSLAAYVQDILTFGPRWSLTLGAREQQMAQEAQQAPEFNGSALRDRGAFDAGAVYRGDGWRAFAKTGSVFRFANTDELFGFNPITYAPVFAGNLLPQHGDNTELGVSFGGGSRVLRVGAFRLNLHDEIAYDGNLFANVNLPATRRQGLETEFDQRFVSGVRLHAAYTYTDARFEEGSYAGNELPLVPHNKVSLQASTAETGVGAYSAAATYVGVQRLSGDFYNAEGFLAGYTTVDLQGRWRAGAWTFTLKAINALDRRYAPYGGYSSYYGEAYYYPADARSLFAGVRYDWR